MSRPRLTIDERDDINRIACIIGRSKRHGELQEAPVKTERSGKWYEVVIGIGPDHVAHLTLDDDALKELKRLSEVAI